MKILQWISDDQTGYVENKQRELINAQHASNDQNNEGLNHFSPGTRVNGTKRAGEENDVLLTLRCMLVISADGWSHSS